MTRELREFFLNLLGMACVVSGTALIVLALDAVLHHLRVWGR